MHRLHKNKTLALLGGDRRMEVARQRLIADGFAVRRLAIGGDEEGDLDSVFASVDAVVLPTPASMDDRTVYAPCGGMTIPWDRVREGLRSGMVLIGGKIPMHWLLEARKRGTRCVDVTESDRLAWKNALPTAEGALAIALQSMPRTLYGSKTVILGYGRIAKCFAPMLLSLGARVVVAARSEIARAEAKERGFTAVDLSALRETIADADLICNTVPSLLLDAAALDACRQDALILDLASKPGGVDRAYAEKLGRNVIWALGLPGKVAPVSAGQYLAEEIGCILREEVEA